jgi:hypothetical protein
MTQGVFVLIRALADVDQRLEYLAQLVREWDFSKPLAVKLVEHKNPRTLSQNALFHMWMGEGSKHFSAQGKENVDPERLKLLLKYKFLGTEDIQVGSKVVPGVVRSTKKLNRGEMHDFMGKCESWLLDLGVKLTIPGDSEYMVMKEAQVA